MEMVSKQFFPFMEMVSKQFFHLWSCAGVVLRKAVLSVYGNG
jgi:hypothetical protein